MSFDLQSLNYIGFKGHWGKPTKFSPSSYFFAKLVAAQITRHKPLTNI